MTEADILHIGGQAIALTAKLAAPLLIVSLVVGIVISLIQTIFSLQDQTLSMVPRIALSGVVLLVTGGWMLRTIVEFTTQLFDSIPSLVR